MPIAHIFGAAETKRRPILGHGDLLLAADGGYKTLIDMGLTPDMALGDFDSLGYTPNDLPILAHPVRKDQTDMALAAEEALERGYDTLYFYGGLGGKRFDHSLANIQLLANLAERGIHACLFGENFTLLALKEGTALFDSSSKGILSVFALSDFAEGVTLEGLSYPLKKHKLTNTLPLGVSNEFIGQRACVSVKKGTLLLLFTDEATLTEIQS